MQTTQSVRDVVRETLREELSDLLEPLVKQYSGQITIADSSLQRLSDNNESSLHSQIDEVRDLIQQGKPVSARVKLLQLQEQYKGQCSNDVTFRIASNLGACAWELDDLVTAGIEIDRALTLQPDNPKAIANAALIALFQDNFERAIDLSKQARALDQKVDNGASVYIQACARLNRTDDLEDLEIREPWILTDSHCTAALAQAYMNMDRYSEAERFARTSVGLKENTPNGYFLLAQTIALPVQQQISKSPPLRWRMDTSLIARAERALDALNRLLEIIKDYEHPKLRYMALSIRSGIYDVLDRDQEALADCVAILSSDTSDKTSRDTAYANKGVVLLRTLNFQEAVNCFEQIIHEDMRRSVLVHLGLCYLELSQPQRALNTILPYWNVSLGEFYQLEMAGILLRAYHTMGKTDEAEKLCTLLEEQSPSKGEARLLIAEQKLRMGDRSEALTHARAALESLTTDASDAAHLRLGQVLFDLQEYRDASHQFFYLVAGNPLSPVTQQYILSLYNAQELEKALEQAQSVRESQGVVAVVTEIETLILEYMGNRAEASKLRKQLAEIDSGKAAQHLIHSAFLDFQQGNKPAAHESISRVTLDQIENDAYALINVAQLRALLEMPEALKYGYQARKLAFNNPDVHMGYMNLCLRHEQQDTALMPTEVGVGCAVKVVQNGEKKTFVIEAEEEPINREKGELHPSDPLASKLLGLKQGETVIIKERPVSNITCVIEEIQSKYTYAFQETINNFEVWFPDAQGIQGFRIAENDFTELISMLHIQEQETTNAVQLFQERKLTIHSFSRLLGRSLFLTWAGIIVSGDLSLFASTMMLPQAQKEIQFIREASEIVIDEVALLTIVHLGLEGKLAETFDTIWVAQATEDEFSEFLSDAIEEKPHPVMGSVEGKPFIHHVGEEEIEQKRAFLKRAVNFINEKTQVVPVMGLLKIPPEEMEKLSTVLGHSTVASILLARDKNVPLYSDEALVRMLADDKWATQGVWSQTILDQMLRCEKITAVEFGKALEKLIVSNYAKPSINAAYLVWILEQYDLIITPSVEKVFAILKAPDCSDESAIIVCTEVIARLWRKYPPQKQTERFAVLKLCVEMLLTSRDREKTLTLFKYNIVFWFRLLSRELITMPLFLDELISAISRFASAVEPDASPLINVTSQAPHQTKPSQKTHASPTIKVPQRIHPQSSPTKRLRNKQCRNKKGRRR